MPPPLNFNVNIYGSGPQREDLAHGAQTERGCGPRQAPRGGKKKKQNLALSQLAGHTSNFLFSFTLTRLHLQSRGSCESYREAHERKNPLGAGKAEL